MNREIRFRAWDGKSMLFSEKSQFYLMPENKVDVPSSTGHEFTRHDYPIMQFTGLKDKNRVDVYEGDVVKYRDANTDTVAAIGFIDGAFTVEYSEKTILHVVYPFIEVIGNIYQNPELLNL